MEEKHNVQRAWEKVRGPIPQSRLVHEYYRAIAESDKILQEMLDKPKPAAEN